MSATGDGVHVPPVPRVAGLPREDAEAAAAAAGVPGYMASLNIFQVLLRQPELARAVSDLLGVLLFKSHLPHRLRELVIMRIGWLTGSAYEWAQHWTIARSFGVSDDDVLAVRDWEGYEAFGPAERAVLAATDEAVRDGSITAATWADCAAALDANDQVLLELVVAIGAWQMIAVALESIEIPLEDGIEPWPPDGLEPPWAGGPGSR